MWQENFPVMSIPVGLTLALLAISTLVAFFARIFLKIYLIEMAVRKSGIPTRPSRHFLRGDTDAFKNSKGKSYMGFFGAAKELGQSVFFMRLLSTPILVITDPTVAQYVMTTRNFPKAAWVYKVITASAPTSLVGLNGFEHRRVRRQVMPAFSVNFLKKQVPVMVERSLFLMKRLDELAGNEINLQEWFGKTALDIVGLLGFGFDFGLVDTGDKEMKHMIDTVIGSQTAILKLDPTVFWRRNNFDKNYISQKKKFDDIARDLIRKGRKEKEEGDTLDPEMMDDQRKNLNILSLLLKTEFKNDWEKPLSDDELIDQIITFIFAGSETSGNTLGFCVAFLSKNPSVLAKLRAEIDAAIEALPSLEDVTYNTAMSLKYLDCVLKEVLRMAPIITATTREVDAHGEVVAGYQVPKGTWLYVSTYAIHHSEALWTDPERFWPERFEQKTIDAEEAAGRKRHSYSYIPFASGATLAQIEIKIILIHFISMFDWDMIKGDPSEFGGTVSLRLNDCIVNLKRRVCAKRGLSRMRNPSLKGATA
ncbi:cytochrome P450 [Jimgerdemannia flammicorona]|uniref:Cytochrome P450 n=1 Tax=Jimgerdemannia flammicorona TaxID=994334 RepID=A0A433QJR9_9FUNG|nr:cytochrome P450 [Jimgerdemannia flammicorona]